MTFSDVLLSLQSHAFTKNQVNKVGITAKNVSKAATLDVGDEIYFQTHSVDLCLILTNFCPHYKPSFSDIMQTSSATLQADQKTLELTQYQYTQSPEKGEPGLLHLCFELRTRNTSKPLLVHCTDGALYTGTFIALDILTDPTCLLDVDKCVRVLREQRMNMVSTQEQYRLLCQLVLEANTSGCAPMTAEQFVTWSQPSSVDKNAETLHQVWSCVAEILRGQSESTISSNRVVHIKTDLSCTLRTLKFSSKSTSEMTGLLHQVTQIQPGILLLVCSSDETASSTNPKAYGNLQIQRKDINQVTRALSVSNVTVSDISGSESYERVQQLHEGDQWSGVCLQLTADNCDNAELMKSLVEVLEWLQENKNAMILFNSEFEVICSEICLCFSVLSSLQTTDRIQLYHSAKDFVLENNIQFTKKSLQTCVSILRMLLELHK